MYDGQICMASFQVGFTEDEDEDGGEGLVLMEVNNKVLECI